MTLKCKPPERWYLVCNECDRASWELTGYPVGHHKDSWGEGWEDRPRTETSLSSSKVLFYNPATFEFSNYPYGCIRRNCKGSMGFTLESRKMTVLEVFQFIDFLIEARKKVAAAVEQFNKLRIFAEACRIDQKGIDNHYDWLHSAETYIDGLIHHVGNRHFGDDFSF